jgi:hypothetical protein
MQRQVFISKYFHQGDDTEYGIKRSSKFYFCRDEQRSNFIMSVGLG